jgi:phosphoribosylglycinamide formyltransferase-1
VLSGDTAAQLAARVLDAEHLLYPSALRLVASGLARAEGEKTIISEDVKAVSSIYSPGL